MLFIGDVHGLWKKYEDVIASTTDDTCQLGDLGIGFGKHWLKRIPRKDRFIRGNHDDPMKCRRHANYLGDYGFDAGANLFYVSGAWSIDWAQRIPEVSWWSEEELSDARLKMALTLFRESKPTVVVTHDAPASLYPQLIGNRRLINTRTSLALQEMLNAHAPEIWLFGHHHLLWKSKIANCQFVCLDELSTFSIPNLKWTN